MEQEAKQQAKRIEAFTKECAGPAMDLYRALKAKGMDVRDAFELTKAVVVEIVRK